VRVPISLDVRIMCSFELGPRDSLDAADGWDGDRLLDVS
jgi:hypothetical protein